MNNRDLERHTERNRIDINDSVNSIISDLIEEIESLETAIEKLEDEIRQANETIEELNNKD
jgi:prefoldin subunit 5